MTIQDIEVLERLHKLSKDTDNKEVLKYIKALSAKQEEIIEFINYNRAGLNHINNFLKETFK
jgi:hypothetical protein